MKRKSEYLLIGHFTKDILPDENYKLGGTVYYSGITAKKLGSEVKILTSFASDIAKEISKNKLLKKMEIINIPSRHSTTFKNVYPVRNSQNLTLRKKYFKSPLRNCISNRVYFVEKRKQFLYSRARKILPKFLPQNWENPSILHLAPLAGEVSGKTAKEFKNSLIGATLQGWLRKKNKDNSVSFNLGKNYRYYLPLFNVAILSEHDVNCDLKLIKEFAKYAQTLVVTKGKKGCVIFQKNKVKIIKPKKIFSFGDLTGTGDVFAAAFLIKFKETKNPSLAGVFANETACFRIEKRIGYSGYQKKWSNLPKVGKI